MDIFGKMYTESGDLHKDAPAMAETLLNTLPLLFAHSGMTMAEIPLLLMDETARKKLLAGVIDHYVQAFWKLFATMKRFDQEALTGSTRRRVNNFLLYNLCRDIVCQGRTTIPFRHIMDDSTILL